MLIDFKKTRLTQNHFVLVYLHSSFTITPHPCARHQTHEVWECFPKTLAPERRHRGGSFARGHPRRHLYCILGFRSPPQILSLIRDTQLPRIAGSQNNSPSDCQEQQTERISPQTQLPIPLGPRIAPMSPQSPEAALEPSIAANPLHHSLSPQIRPWGLFYLTPALPYPKPTNRHPQLLWRRTAQITNVSRPTEPFTITFLSLFILILYLVRILKFSYCNYNQSFNGIEWSALLILKFQHFRKFSRCDSGKTGVICPGGHIPPRFRLCVK